MWQYNHTDELYHHGVKGMKWGVRRRGLSDKTLGNAKKVADSGHQLANELKRVNDKNAKRLSRKNRPDFSKLTDEQMRKEINRYMLERQYSDMISSKNVSRGRAAAGRILDIAGDTLAIAGAGLGVALAAKKLLKKGG